MAWARVREERQPCGRKVSRWVGAGVFTQGRACGSGWRRCQPPAAWASAGLQMCAGSSRPGPHPTHRGALSKAAVRRPGRLPGSSLLALRPTRPAAARESLRQQLPSARTAIPRAWGWGGAGVTMTEGPTGDGKDGVQGCGVGRGRSVQGSLGCSASRAEGGSPPLFWMGLAG